MGYKLKTALILVVAFVLLAWATSLIKNSTTGKEGQHYEVTLADGKAVSCKFKGVRRCGVSYDGCSDGISRLCQTNVSDRLVIEVSK